MASGSRPDLDKFVEKTKALLELERNEEIAQTEALLNSLPPKELSDRGLILDKLEVVTQCTGLGGKWIVRFEPKQRDTPLKSGNKFQPGDIVAIKDEESKETVDSGVIFRVSQKWLQVAFAKPNDAVEGSRSSFTLVHLANNVTFKRMESAINQLVAKKTDSPIANVLFGTGGVLGDVTPVEFTPFDTGLNSSQVEAVKFALGASVLALIHGPPGTGKTTTVVELIRQAVARGEKVLVCAPSNIAVDNIAEKLAKAKVKMVRLGHPARFLPNVISHSLDIVVQESNGGEVVRGIITDMNALQGELREVKGAQRDRMFREWLTLKKELKSREIKAVEDVLSGCAVVLATCSGAADRYLKSDKFNNFDLVVIDEAGQALEAACWVPLLKGKRAVLAGDHLQLPPTIHSEKAAKDGLSLTLFERIIKTFGDKVSRMLRVQYRMNQDIMGWASKALYQSKLIADQHVKERILTDFDYITAGESTSCPLAIIDTQGCFLDELSDIEGSKYNSGEGSVCLKYAQELLASGVKEEDIAVITPYYAQVKVLRQLFFSYPGININTVDGFQGREKEVILISMVRSNEKKEVGFLAEKRRMNVAVTRAKRHCCIVCNSDTVSSDKFLRKMVSYFQNKGLYLSAESFIDTNVAVSTTTVTQTPQPTPQPSAKATSQASTPVSELTPMQQTIVDRLLAFKEQPVQENENPELPFRQPLSKVNAAFLQQQCEDLGLFCNIYTFKQSTLATVYITPPKERDTDTPSEPPALTPQPVSKPQPKKKAEPAKPTPKPQATATPHTGPQPKFYENPFRKMTDEDALDQVIANKNKCFFVGCKHRVTNLGAVCEFCKEAFCYEHGLPFKHGCADAMREKAQREFKEQAKKQESGTKTTPLRPGQRAALHDKLQKKIEEQKGNRTKKPNEKSAKR